jgi:hypothetical protein
VKKRLQLDESLLTKVKFPIDDMTTVRSETSVAPDLFHGGDAMGAYQGLTEHVVMSRTPCTLRGGVCAAGIEQTQMAGAFGEPSRKGVAEAMNDNKYE